MLVYLEDRVNCGCVANVGLSPLKTKPAIIIAIKTDGRSMKLQLVGDPMNAPTVVGTIQIGTNGQSLMEYMVLISEFLCN